MVLSCLLFAYVHGGNNDIPSVQSPVLCIVRRELCDLDPFWWFQRTLGLLNFCAEFYANVHTFF